MTILQSIALVFLIQLVVGMISAIPIWILWNNCLVPAIPSILEISPLQAFGLYILSALMFKSDANTK